MGGRRGAVVDGVDVATSRRVLRGLGTRWASIDRYLGGRAALGRETVHGW